MTGRYDVADVPAYLDADTGETYLGTRLPAALGEDATDRYETPRAGERPEAFAVRVWAERGMPAEQVTAARLWDVICDLNDITNPLAPLPERPLRVPSLARVLIDLER